MRRTSSRSALTGICLVALIASAGCERSQSEVDHLQTERNKALARRWIEEGFNQRHLSVVDQLFAERFSVNGQIIGRDGLRQSMSRHFDAFPDLHVRIDEIIADADKVGIWYTASGSHRGEFEAIPPTGAHVQWVGFDLLTIERGEIAEARFISDHLGLLTQLGATVSVETTAEPIRRDSQ
jgi:steroid delta-isomerase-like uncharacterized protein